MNNEYINIDLNYLISCINQINRLSHNPQRKWWDSAFGNHPDD